MPRPVPLEQVHSDMADEHRRIMALISRIEAQDSVAVLPPMLKTLHDLLVDHFAHEQFPGGLYERMGAHGPEHHETLRTLVREHCEVLSNARALVERSRSVDSVGETRLLHEVAELIEMLRAHEIKEHRLVERLKDSARARS